MYPPLMKSGSSGIVYDEKASHVILDQRAAEDAADIAIQKSVRGMDALVMQTAKEYEKELVTFDNEMMKKLQTP